MVEDSFESLPAGDRAVIEPGPDCFAAAPQKFFGLLLTPERLVRRVRFADRAVLADQVRHAGIDEQPSPVAVVAGDVAELVDVAALRPADGGRARRVQLMA